MTTLTCAHCGHPIFRNSHSINDADARLYTHVGNFTSSPTTCYVGGMAKCATPVVDPAEVAADLADDTRDHVAYAEGLESDHYGPPE